MRRKIVIALLAFGTFAGYGSAIAHAAHMHHHHGPCGHGQQEDRASDEP